MKMASSQHYINQGITDVQLQTVVSVLRKKGVFGVKKSKVHYMCKSYDHNLIVDGVQGTIIQVGVDSKRWKNSINKGKVMVYKGIVILILNSMVVRQQLITEGEEIVKSMERLTCGKRKKKIMRSEAGLFEAIRGTFNFSHFFLKGVMMTITCNPVYIGWVMQILTVLADLHDPYTYGLNRMMSVLVRILAIVLQGVGSYNNFVSQGLTLSDMVLMLSIAGLPYKIVQKLEVFQKISGKRFSDSSLLMTIINEFLEIVLMVIEYIASKDPLGFLPVYATKLRDSLSFVTTYQLIKEMTELVATYHKNQQIILDVQYRVKCTELSEKVSKSMHTIMFCRDVQNKISNLTWNDFNSIMVLVKNYSISSRMEPVCIVFEGAAGVGKSTFMNKLVAALKHTNHSVYCHTVPDINSGKDFYDDYMNQDVFVMDDVGQQGKSQWRSIINFVAPVKYPLECASAEKKNTKFFASKLILCTTNCFMNLHGFTSKDCIAEPEALFRRCHVLKFDKLGGRNIIRYYKYDYMNQHAWKNGALAPWDDIGIMPIYEGTERENLQRIYKMVVNLLEVQKELNDGNAMSRTDLEYITGDTIEDAVEEEEDENQVIVGDVYHDANLESEGISEFMTKSKEVLQEIFNSVKDKLRGVSTSDTSLPNVAMMGGIMTVLSALAFMVYSVIGRGNENINENDSDISEVIESWKQFSSQKHPLFSESGLLSTEDDTNGVKRYFRFFEIFYYHEGVMKTEYCQGSVSGKYCLLPLHCLGENITMNIFKNWDRYQSKHYEFNLVPGAIVKSYPHLDLAIVELQKLPVVPYKNAHMLFKKHPVRAFSQDLYFCNSFHKIRNVFGVNIKMSMDSFKVVNYRQELSFGPGAGLLYDISALGLCGSMIVDRDNGMVGVHIAGNGQDGFAVVPSLEIRNEISQIMLSAKEPNMDHKDSDKYENFSGSRILYDKAQLSYSMEKSNFYPTPLNKDYNETVADLCEKYSIVDKRPADVKKYGSPSKTLESCSRKSFSPMKPIPKEEIEFAKDCLRSLFVEFSDLTDEETAFGKGYLIPPLNKDSANGYGYKKDKSDYIDFQRKTLSDEFLGILNDVVNRIENEEATWEDFVAKEALKDELRPLGKDPRTFRVMPLHHIFLVKKYLGNLFAHVRKNMWTNGVAIGMNPYKDWPKLYNVLKGMAGVMALDFGKWDGSCHAMIQDLVVEVVMEFYKGSRAKVLECLLNSTVRGFTLVKDELLMTTHSIPSGAWITAFFNSLINKMLTAITLYRNMKKHGRKATVADFLRVADFVLGDDKITGVPSDLVAYVNALTLSEVAKSLGMDVTDSLKRPVTKPFQKLEECTFLKRSFSIHPELGLVGPLSLDTILNTIQWYDASKSYDDAMNGKAIVVQIESYLHSENMLNEIQKVLSNYDWYREFDKHQIQAILLRDAEEAFGMMKRLLDKNYV